MWHWWSQASPPETVANASARLTLPARHDLTSVPASTSPASTVSSMW
jgi:hypothetical protein